MQISTEDRNNSNYKMRKYYVSEVGFLIHWCKIHIGTVFLLFDIVLHRPMSTPLFTGWTTIIKG